jgi:G:T-mismatch repair DNA endonuclease (very short patch repair protein)
MMWLVYSELTDGCCINHGRNGREQKLPALPYLSVDGICAETKTVYKLNGCYWHGHLCHQIRDFPTVPGDTLAESYEKTMALLAQITQAEYQVQVNGNVNLIRGY